MSELNRSQFVPATTADIDEMLAQIGVESFEELISNIPVELREFEERELPEGISEFEALRELQEMAGGSRHSGDSVSFLGGGSYDHFIPSIIGEIISRSEFLTAYTPYQPEVSQGTLQAIFEYQSMICALTGMDAANASMYDGASALAEAGLLALGHTGRDKIVVASTVNPNYRSVVSTYIQGRYTDIEIAPHDGGVTDPEGLKNIVDDDTAAVLVQSPNFFGCLEDLEEFSGIAHERGALFIVSVDPISLGLLKRPGDYGADLVVGEGQALGSPTGFGGPYLGIFAATMDLIRKMPGRIVGQTRDLEGRRGYVLTLQTREQHIRRERATSNICTNEGIVMLASTVYMALMGKNGLRRVADLCVQKSHYLAERIAGIEGFGLFFDAPFLKEFVVKTPGDASELISKLSDNGILAGIDLSPFDYGLKNAMLVAVTEKRTRDEMDTFIDLLSEVSA